MSFFRSTLVRLVQRSPTLHAPPPAKLSAFAAASSPAPTSSAAALRSLITDVTPTSVSALEAQTTRTLLDKIPQGSFITPRALAPEKLLNPYPAKARFDLAYPLGPPTTETKTHDPFAFLALDPRISPMNPFLRTDYCTSMGKIQGRGKTGLGRASQRSVGKAVRRARSMGVIAVWGKSEPDAGRTRR